MDIRKEIDLSKPLTHAQEELLSALATRPVSPAQDCPELTPEQLMLLKRVSTRRDK